MIFLILIHQNYKKKHINNFNLILFKIKNNLKTILETSIILNKQILFF
jgi:hypothetical protein